MTPETLRSWVRQAERDNGGRPGLTTDEKAKLKDLERELEELRRAQRDPQSCLGFLRGGARQPTETMTAFIGDNRYRWGIEPICGALPIAPSTYYAARKRPPSDRTQRDEYLKVQIERVWKDNYRVYGADKVWAQLNREDLQFNGQPVRVARVTVEGLMPQLGIQGAVRGKQHRTTTPVTGPNPNCLT